MDGYLALLVGQGVPHSKPYTPTPAEQEFVLKRCAQLTSEARQGMTVREALAALRSPNVRWA
jgi:hypothetical protein